MTVFIHAEFFSSKFGNLHTIVKTYVSSLRPGNYRNLHVRTQSFDQLTISSEVETLIQDEVLESPEGVLPVAKEVTIHPC